MTRNSSINNFSNFTGVYCFGFNGKESDNSTSADSYDFGARIYSARLGKWFVVDDYVSTNASDSPYSFAWNNPLIFIDKDGKNGRLIIDHEKHQITLETTVFLHGVISPTEMQSICDEFNASFSQIDNTMLIRDRDNPDIQWTVTINVEFCFESTLNDACQKLGLNDGEATDNAIASIENKEAYGIEDGDNLLEITNSPKYADGYTGQGSDEGVSSNVFGTAIHEVGHQLGFDERYLAYAIDDRGNRQTLALTIFCEGIENDFMSNSFVKGGIPEIQSFHFTDIVDYVLANACNGEEILVVGNVKKVERTEKIGQDGVKLVFEKIKTTEHKFDDTNHGNNTCSDVPAKNDRATDE